MSTVPSTNKYPELMDRSLDLSSESLIEFAVNNNPSIKSSQIYLKILEHSKLIERSANLPKVDLEVATVEIGMQLTPLVKRMSIQLLVVLVYHYMNPRK